MLIFTRRPDGLCRVDAAQHLGQTAPAGHPREFRLVERVERDVDPAHPGRVEVAREALELRAVGGDGQFVEIARVKDDGSSD